MIQHITIDGEERPFMFTLRAIFGFMNASQVASIDEAQQQVALDFDAMLQLFAEASEVGKKEDKDYKGKAFTAKKLEDAINKDPKIFMSLKNAWEDSKAMKAFEGEVPEKK